MRYARLSKPWRNKYKKMMRRFEANYWDVINWKMKATDYDLWGKQGLWWAKTPWFYIYREKFAYCWFLRIALPHLVSVLSENQVSPAERVVTLPSQLPASSIFIQLHSYYTKSQRQQVCSFTLSLFQKSSYGNDRICAFLAALHKIQKWPPRLPLVDGQGTAAQRQTKRLYCGFPRPITLQHLEIMTHNCLFSLMSWQILRYLALAIETNSSAFSNSLFHIVQDGAHQRNKRS